MKKLILFFCILSFTIQCFAQPPASFKYQAVVRDNQGAVLSNQIVGLRISILRNSTTANSVYVETHQIATNQFGIVNIEVGKGTVVSGTFKNIDWGSAAYYIKTELDIAQSGSYEFIGTSQLLSVPYSLYATESGKALNDNDTSATNELQTLSKKDSLISLSQGGGSVTDSDNQSLSLSGFDLSISGGNTITLPPDIDHDSLNEIQEISKIGNTVTLSKNGGSITDSDNQTLSLQGNKLSISNGNILTLSDAIDLDSDPLNELQVLSKSGDTLFLSKGNYIVFDHDADLDSTNELQTLSREGDTLFLSNGNYVVFDHDADLDSTNEIQVLSLTVDTLRLSKSNINVILPISIINGITAFEKDTTWIVPKGIKKVTVKAWSGGQGGSSQSVFNASFEGYSQSGSFAYGIINVKPNDSLNITIGLGGKSSTGYYGLAGGKTKVLLNDSLNISLEGGGGNDISIINCIGYIIESSTSYRGYTMDKMKISHSRANAYEITNKAYGGAGNIKTTYDNEILAGEKGGDGYVIIMW